MASSHSAFGKLQRHTSVFNMDMQMTLCAWAVRTALLLLYIPVQMLSFIVETANLLDSWASAAAAEAAMPSGSRQPGTDLKRPGDSVRAGNMGAVEA